MIRLIELGDNSERKIRPSELKGQKLENVWLDLVDPSEDELQAAADATEFPINFLRLPETDAVVELRLELGYSVINFLVMQDAGLSKKVDPVIIVFSKNFLVTVTHEAIEGIIKNAKERMKKVKIDPPALVAYYIIDEVVAYHYAHIEKLEDLTSNLEEEVIESTKRETLEKIFKLKSKMISFNKILWYERGLVFKLHKCGDSCMPAKVAFLFDTTHEDLTRQIDIVETYREILSDAINVHLSAISNKINISINSLTIVIFYLTIITTVTSFPNTVATFFGIAQFGNTNTIIVIATLLASIILPLVWLWKKKWLSIKTALRQRID